MIWPPKLEDTKNQWVLKMLATSSSDFKKKFILEFTRELIINSSPMELFKLEHILKDEKKLENKFVSKIKEKVKLKAPKRDISREDMSRMPSVPKFIQRPSRAQPLPQKPLSVPRPRRLPPQFQHLRPTFQKAEIKLGKLDPFINDSQVKNIECNGPDSQIQVSGNMGTKPTNVTLTKEEIEEVLQKFSEKGKVPIDEGFNKIIVGNLILNAIVSEDEESETKFTITKMSSPPRPGMMPRR